MLNNVISTNYKLPICNKITQKHNFYDILGA